MISVTFLKLLNLNSHSWSREAMDVPCVLPRRPTRSFQDSVTCINFLRADAAASVQRMLLTDFVPGNAQSEDVPCHHIPLNAEGETVDTLRDNQLKLEEALEAWLRATIHRLEQERAAAAEEEHT